MDSEALALNALEAIKPAIEHATRRAWEEGYAAGQRAAKSKMLAALEPDTSAAERVNVEITPDVVAKGGPAATEFVFASKPADQRRRAPKGLPRRLVARALAAKPEGAVWQDVIAAAITPEEKMIQPSTIRGELRQGNGKLYAESQGLWYLLEASANG